MTNGQGFTLSRERSQWVRLRTLVVLRWVAILGQIAAVLIADRILGLEFSTGLCFLVIGAAVIANLLAIFLFPENKRLSEFAVTSILVFDVAQLALLLSLTGGLHNPFALMVLAPVAVGATALKLRSILILVVVTLILMTLSGLYHQPMRTAEGLLLRLPTLFVLGFWGAIFAGVVFLAVLIQRVSDETHSMGDALLATQMALAREQKLTDLGGVVAAAAHELGTPLATIKLVSSEMSEELEPESTLHEDVRLIGEQADRCRDILRSMGRAGKDDLYTHTAPLSAVLDEAAEPHMARGKAVHFAIGPEGGAKRLHPAITRAPGVIHGIRNLIQNAVDFADANVWVDASWSDDKLTVKISDDGPGYPTHLIGRIGDPFMRRRRRRPAQRPEYEGMGLGLFIAKTLLERSGAEIVFTNGSDPFLKDAERPERRGAIVDVTWGRTDVGPAETAPARGLGENQRFQS